MGTIVERKKLTGMTAAGTMTDNMWLYVVDPTVSATIDQSRQVSAPVAHTYFNSDIYQQVVTVAKAGGDYTSIQDAIDSITDASDSKRYAVKVYPGNYAEAVTMQDYVDIIGTGRTNSRITGTSGTVLTFPATKGTILDMGIYVDYGALGANSQAIVSAGADSVMIRCDIGVTKSSGDFQMNALYISAGAFRMSDSYFTYSVTGATTDTALVQSAVVQTGVLTTVILNNNEMTITSNDTNDFLVGFETTANVTGTALLANNVIDIEGASVGACGGLWLYGTGSGMVANQNRLTVNCDTLAYGIFIDSTAGGATIDTRHNEIIITSAGTAQSANVAAGDTWNSTFDKITAANGYSGAGTINFVSSQIDGEFTTTGNVGVGVTSPSAKLHVDQETAGAAIPVLYLDQADVSEEMIEFASTIGVGNAIEAVGIKTLTTTHFIKVTLPGGLTRYIPVGTIA
ncbi:MAG: autotransporter outer membrane beta-barrel domain-containing protein [Planctomycetota bacterium]